MDLKISFILIRLRKKLNSPIWSERLCGRVGLWRTVSLVVTGVREQW